MKNVPYPYSGQVASATVVCKCQPNTELGELLKVLQVVFAQKSCFWKEDKWLPKTAKTAYYRIYEGNIWMIYYSDEDKWLLKNLACVYSDHACAWKMIETHLGHLK